MSTIYAYNKYGSEKTRGIIQRVLCHIIQPLIKNICSWVYFGMLEDKYKEFFFERNDEEQTWEFHYFMREHRVPTFIKIEHA